MIMTGMRIAVPVWLDLGYMVQKERQGCQLYKPSRKNKLNSQNLQTIAVTNRNPIGEGRRPVDNVDFPARLIRQDGVVNGSRHVMNIPDQRLRIFS